MKTLIFACFALSLAGHLSAETVTTISSDAGLTIDSQSSFPTSGTAFTDSSGNVFTLTGDSFGALGIFYTSSFSVEVSFANPTTEAGFELAFGNTPSSVSLSNGDSYSGTPATPSTTFWGVEDSATFTAATFDFSGSGLLRDFAFSSSAASATPEPATGRLLFSFAAVLFVGRKLSRRRLRA